MICAGPTFQLQKNYTTKLLSNHVDKGEETTMLPVEVVFTVSGHFESVTIVCEIAIICRYAM